MKRHYLTSTAAICGLTLALVVWAPPASAGTVFVSTPQAMPGSVDFTAAGTLDWAHWGLEPNPTSPPSFNHKDAGGGVPVGLISNIGGGTGYTDAGNPYQVDWTDGTPATSATTTGFAYGAGFTFTVAAAAETRFLDVYVGTFVGAAGGSDPHAVRGKLVATMSGGGSDTASYQLPTTTGGLAWGVYSIEFSGEGETVTVEWANDPDHTTTTDYNMQIRGATLVPEPGTAMLLLLGGLPVLMARRRTRG